MTPERVAFVAGALMRHLPENAQWEIAEQLALNLGGQIVSEPSGEEEELLTLPEIGRRLRNLESFVLPVNHLREPVPEPIPAEGMVGTNIRTFQMTIEGPVPAVVKYRGERWVPEAEIDPIDKTMIVSIDEDKGPVQIVHINDTFHVKEGTKS